MLKEINFVELESFLLNFKENKHYIIMDDSYYVINRFVSSSSPNEISTLLSQIEEIIHTYPFPWLYIKKLTGFEFRKKITYIGWLLEIIRMLEQEAKIRNKITNQQKY